MNLSPCGSGLVLHQTTASGMGFYIRRMMLWSHTAVQTKHAVSQAPWGRKQVENCLENTFITNFRNATFKVQQEGAAVFVLTASKVLLWQEGRWVGRVFAHNYPFPWAAKVRGEVRWKQCCLSAGCVAASCLKAMEAGCRVDAVEFHKVLATAPAHRGIPRFPMCVIGSFSPLVVFNAHSKFFAPDAWGPRCSCHLCLCGYLLPLASATAKLFLTLLYIWNFW